MRARHAAQLALTATRLAPAPLLLAAALAALALLGVPGQARADAAQVTVVSPGGEERPLALEALVGDDVKDRTYALRSATGTSSRTVSGYSLGTLLKAADADPFSFSYLEVQRPGGGAVTLSRYQALDPGAFAEGPPVVYATAGGTGFIRPSGGSEDLNAPDCFEAPQGLRIVLRKGVQLRVRATASPLKVRPREQVKFSASVAGAGSGERLFYSWTFGDGRRAADAGPQVSHSFAKPGSYKVIVGVTAPGNETGESATVRIQVGQPTKGGPDREGGGKNKHEDAPDQGAADGPAGGAGAGEPSAAIPPPASFPATTAPESRPTVTEPPPAAEAEPQPREPEPEGEGVSGLLIGNTAPAAAAGEQREAAQQAAARTGTPGEEDGGSGGLPTAAWGILAGAGLLGAGALAEAAGGFGGLLRLRRLGP